MVSGGAYIEVHLILAEQAYMQMLDLMIPSPTEWLHSATCSLKEDS